jgi:uncharacterized membrane protein
MCRRFLDAVGRAVATVMMALGVSLVTGSLLIGLLALMEGVTHLVGEGDVASPETPEQVHRRLTLVASLVGVAAAGWTLARLGDRERRPRMTRLAAEVLLFLGGLGLAFGILIAFGSRAAMYEVAEEYRRVGVWAPGIGLVLLGPGLLLLRWSRRGSTGRGVRPSTARPSPASDPAEGDGP